MNKFDLKFRGLILLLFLVSTTMGQQVYNSTINNEISQSKELTNADLTGNTAFCMITGGNGTTGWATFPLQDPTSFTIIAPKPGSLYFLGGDFGADGIWYCTEWAGGLYSVDTTSADYTLLGNLGITPSGFTYSPAYETYYCCSGSELYSVDMENYTAELIGPMGNSGDMTGLGADNRGNLYGVDKNDDQLYAIDPNTGLATAMGPSGYDFDYLQNCTYDKDYDIMYHAGFWVSPSVHGGLYTFNLNTGEATELSSFPTNEEVTAFSIPWTMPDHGSISGEASDATTGDPVADVEIYIEPTSDPLGTNLYNMTGADGFYSFGVVLPGTYKIIAVSANYGVAIVDDIVVNAGDDLTVDFELQIAPWTATFYVYLDSNNEPLEGATVKFVNQSLQTNSQGMVVFENIANGTYDYTVEYDGFYDGFGEVEVNEGNMEEEVYLIEENNVPVNLVIIEEATGTWCGPCSVTAPLLDQIYEEGYPVSIIAYHASDDYANSFSDARNGYYGVVAYPTLTFNGLDQIHNEPYNTILSYVEDYMDDETPVTLDYTDVVYNMADNTVTGTINVENLGPINSDHMRVHVALVENHIPELWQGLPELNFVERTMFPDENGTSIDLKEVSAQEVEFEVSLDDILELSNCQIVVFVQDNFNRTIYNGLIYECSILTGIEENILNSQVVVFPNPATNEVNVKAESAIKQLSIFNHLGQQVYESTAKTKMLNVDVSDMDSGIYFFKIITDNGIIVKQVVIQ